MKFVRFGLLAGLLGMSAAAQAGFDADVGVFSRYYFRGLEQTTGAAVQGGLEWTGEALAEAGGIKPYAGAWASNLDQDFGLGSVETDVYGGARLTWQDINFDAGARYFYFPDADDSSDTATFEPYVGAGYGPAELYVHYTPDYYGSGDDSWYVRGGLTLPIYEKLVGNAQVGLTSGAADYEDYSVSLLYPLPWFELAASVSYVITSADGQDDRFIAGISRGFAF